MVDCDFCLRLTPGYQPTSPYDFAVVGVSESFQVVAALGAIAPGHVLIVSNEHVPSMASLSPKCRSELLELTKSWRERLGAHFGNEIVVFEHGSLSDESTGGACIVHAHWQLVPLPRGVAVPPKGFTRYTDLSVIDRLSGKDYQLLENGSGVYVSPDSRTERGHQFWRRTLLAAVDRPAEWDYLAYPNIPAMDATLDVFVSAAPPGLSMSGEGTNQ